MKSVMMMAGLVMAAGTASAQIQMTEITRLNFDAEFNSSSTNGSNVSAVAWDGRDLFVGGFNSTGGTGSAGIVKVSDALGAGARSAFGSLTTPDGRGYSGLDISGGRLAAAYDDGAADPNGITAWDASTASQLWAKSARGGSGVAFDPGFGGVDAGVAWTTFGSGRRALQDSATGADIYTTANGMIINTGSGTFWRDMDFDDRTGDLYARRSNGLFKTTRTGGNSGNVSQLIAFSGSTDFIAGHNLAVVFGSNEGDFVIYNNRTSTSNGQAAASVLSVVGLDGSSVGGLVLNLIGGGTLGTSNGYYDFSYDAASGTLAIADFANRNVHIFQIPTPGAVALLGLGGLAAARRRRG